MTCAVVSQLGRVTTFEPTKWPSPPDFYVDFWQPAKPVLMMGLALSMPAIEGWASDELVMERDLIITNHLTA